MSTTHFGFQTIDSDEKSARVRGVFDAVASRYDLMNDVMSAGLHRLWKRHMVAWLGLSESMRVLDVAGGTGDIAFRMEEAAGCLVVVCDLTEAMVVEGKNRAIDRNAGVKFSVGNAEDLPFADDSFDVYTIAFGLRNVTHIDRALAEAKRVLKPGGRFVCLEFSHVEQPLLRKFYDAYSFHLIPKFGAMIAGDAAPYQYLVESIRRFPKPRELARQMEQAGFSLVRHHPLTHGVVAMHTGRKIS